jgi:gas vesicle protein
MNDQDSDNTELNPGGFLAGLLMGGLLSAVAMLLLAPQSGKRMRARIKRDGLDLRDQVAETLTEAAARARGKFRRVAAHARKETRALLQRGEDVLEQQRDIMSIHRAERVAAHSHSGD